MDEVRKMFGRFADGRQPTTHNDEKDAGMPLKYLMTRLLMGYSKRADSIARLKKARGCMRITWRSSQAAKVMRQAVLSKKIVKENPTSEEVMNSRFTISGFNKAGAESLRNVTSKSLALTLKGWKATPSGL